MTVDAPTTDVIKSNSSDIELILGNTNILLIAPHGHPDDDEKTGEQMRHQFC